jgi:hypothetical protein
VTVPGGAGRPALLVFLTTTCASCASLWEQLNRAPLPPELGVDLVVVTPSAAMDDEARARRLLPPGARLHMASGTWFEYGMLQAGSLALVRAAAGGPPPWECAGEVLGSSSPVPAEEIPELVNRWLGQARSARPRK